MTDHRKASIDGQEIVENLKTEIKVLKDAGK